MHLRSMLSGRTDHPDGPPGLNRTCLTNIIHMIYIHMYIIYLYTKTLKSIRKTLKSATTRESFPSKIVHLKSDLKVGNDSAGFRESGTRQEVSVSTKPVASPSSLWPQLNMSHPHCQGRSGGPGRWSCSSALGIAVLSVRSSPNQGSRCPHRLAGGSAAADPITSESQTPQVGRV